MIVLMTGGEIRDRLGYAFLIGKTFLVGSYVPSIWWRVMGIMSGMVATSLLEEKECIISARTPEGSAPNV
jgi:hypothetical protein